MDRGTKARFDAVLSRCVDAHVDIPTLDKASASRLLERTENVPFFAHSYTFYHNMIHGFTPHDLARFAYEHDLHGLCLHISDGDSLNDALENLIIARSERIGLNLERSRAA